MKPLSSGLPPCREGGINQCPVMSRSAFREPNNKVPPSSLGCPTEGAHTPQGLTKQAAVPSKAAAGSWGYLFFPSDLAGACLSPLSSDSLTPISQPLLPQPPSHPHMLASPAYSSTNTPSSKSFVAAAVPDAPRVGLRRQSVALVL